MSTRSNRNGEVPSRLCPRSNSSYYERLRRIKEVFSYALRQQYNGARTRQATTASRGEGRDSTKPSKVRRKVLTKANGDGQQALWGREIRMKCFSTTFSFCGRGL